MNPIWEKYKEARKEAVAAKNAHKKAKKKLKYFYDTLLKACNHPETKST